MKYPVDFSKTFYIGDSYVDVKAATSVGCTPLLVLTGNGSNAIKQYSELKNIPAFKDLAEAVDFVLKHH